MPRLDLDHRAGNHCGSTSLRDLSTYYGWGFDEPACFGLASGLGFSYLRLPERPHRLFFGRPEWLEYAFFENLDVDHRRHEGQAFEDAWAAITARVDAGDPVMIFTDLFYLEYYDTDTHFAPHSLLVVGYDERDGHVHLADSEFADVQALALDRLEAAMTSTHVTPLQCRYLTVEDPTPGRSFATAATAAVRETATYMLDPSSASRESRGFGEQGVPAIRALAADLPSWHELEDPAWTARFAYQNVERRGTGGGAFRRMYAAFLEASADALSLPDALPGRMADVAAAWTDLGAVLLEASETDAERERRSLLARAGERADALADREAAIYEDLLDALPDETAQV